ncbi:MAG: 5-formyltetrahydrofolate cyclo-ligase [Flavobacteriaceae bacterium]|jgi:5-formyltetrahydrofolate cyclo-ligase|nr:5-formyltetrahydrofolate cyclo-ligase [Flavobacteriaceae bacterium]
MDKSQIRIHYKKLREKLSEDEVMERSLNIANQCLELPVWEKQIFHLFLTIEDQKEVDTSLILTLLQGKDKEVVVPKILDKENLQHFLLTDQTCFEVNSLGIPEPKSGIEIEPSKIDVVFIPLLAFDSTGNRIGYGKGFYDRFLALCKPDCIKIGLSFFDHNQSKIVSEATDVPLDYCVTPERVYCF